MSKKLKGFSLAELLISLLVISIVLSAAIPTLTKRSSQDRSQIWKWSTSNNSTYFGLGANQSVLIGAPNMPLEEKVGTGSSVVSTIMAETNPSSPEEIRFSGSRYTTSGDKLVILKKSLLGHTTNMANSHISFYNIQGGAASTVDNITYGGRIAVDKHNLAFGRATLLSMDDIDSDYQGENTAVGHYALMATTSGERNVAVGEKTLSFNTDGSFNTALGFLAGNKLGSDDRENRSVAGLTVTEVVSSADSELPSGTTGETNYASRNTAIGSYAMNYNHTGFGNTSIGAQSLNNQTDGHGNTAVGYHSLGMMDKGYGNTSIGANSCGYMTEGNYNICIGNAVFDTRTKDNYSLAIGSTAPLLLGQGAAYSGEITGGGENTQRSVPLITGHTQKTGSFDKELIVNSKNVIFKPYNGGSFPTFQFISSFGDINNGKYYGQPQDGVTSEAYFNLRYMHNSTLKDSVTMRFSAMANQAVIGTFNPNTIGEANVQYTDLSFNERLNIDMPEGDLQYPSELDITDTAMLISGLPKVGINGKLRGLDQYYDVIINNRLNVSGKAAHIVNIDKFGTKIVGDNDASKYFMFASSKTGDPELHIQDNKVMISGAGGVFIQGSNTDETQAPLSVQGTDVRMHGLRGVSGLDSANGSVVESFKKVLKQIDDLETKISGYHSSDARLKNISGDNTAGLAEINKLEVKNYTYKKDDKKTPHVGVIAQQLQKVFPTAVIENEDGYLMIRTEEIFYAMVNSIKELFVKIQDLAAKVVGLDKRITELEAQNKMLLEQNKAFEKRLEKLEQQVAK